MVLKRKVILSKDTVLWYAGDPARTFAIVESGKLGVKTDKGLVGIVWPHMVLGEAALLALEGEQPKRTATVYALEEGTAVLEYPPMKAKQAIDEQAHDVWRAILTTLLGQVCRNCLVLVAAQREQPFVASTFRSLMQTLVANYKGRFSSLQSWDDFTATFHFLFSAREFTESAQRALLGPFSDRDYIIKASEITREFFQEKGDVPFLRDFLSAAQERWSLADDSTTGR